MLRGLFLLFIVCFHSQAFAQDAPKKIESLPRAEVVRIIDGDTIEIKQGAGVERCRLLGVDCPELKGEPDKTFYGREAAWFTYNLLAGESIWFEADPKIPRDTFGRRLIFAYRAPDGLFVNAELLRQGYARIYKDYENPHAAMFEQAEARARAAMKGLWNPNLAKTAEQKKAGPKAEPKQTPAAANSVVLSGSDSDTVYATNSGTKFHRAGCRSLRKSSNPLTRAAAQGRGLTPCSVCKP
ncbi:MAG: thermonuclease family protein [Candidatus Sumerlaeia bacterium]